MGGKGLSPAKNGGQGCKYFVLTFFRDRAFPFATITFSLSDTCASGNLTLTFVELPFLGPVLPI